MAGDMPDPGASRLGPIGLIGLGAMGEPIARNLICAGVELMLYTRSAAKAEPFSATAKIAANARDVFEQSAGVLLAVPGEGEIDDVLGRSRGELAVPVTDTIVVNICTVSPDYSESVGRVIEDHGGRYLEAPLSGSRKPAEAGSLVVLAAAWDDALIDQVQPLFDVIGKATLRCGAPPEAMRLKLANNLLLITLLLGYAQAFTYARALGVDQRRFVELVELGPMANDVFHVKAGMLLDGDFSPQASIGNVHKDARLIDAEATRHHVRAPYAQVNARLLAEAIEDGWGGNDIIGVARLLERATAGGLSI